MQLNGMRSPSNQYRTCPWRLISLVVCKLDILYRILFWRRKACVVYLYPPSQKRVQSRSPTSSWSPAASGAQRWQSPPRTGQSVVAQVLLSVRDLALSVIFADLLILDRLQGVDGLGRPILSTRGAASRWFLGSRLHRVPISNPRRSGLNWRLWYTRHLFPRSKSQDSEFSENVACPGIKCIIECINIISPGGFSMYFSSFDGHISELECAMNTHAVCT